MKTQPTPHTQPMDRPGLSWTTDAADISALPAPRHEAATTSLRTMCQARWWAGQTCAVVAAVALSLLVARPVRAATIVVSNTNDSGAGSLRQAIADAAGGDTITFSVTGMITLSSGELLIDKDLTIDGPGADQLTISGNQATRVFAVASGVTAVLQKVTISHGAASAGSNGGGILNQGTLTVNNSTVSDNSAGEGLGSLLYGGGISNEGTLTVNNSTVAGNSATTVGGITSVGGSLTLTNSTVADNRASFGGGIAAGLGSLTLTNSTVAGNLAGLGGGIFVVASSLTLTNSTVSDNSGGSIGGGILSTDGSLTLTNSTVAGNSATTVGGGIYAAGESGADITFTLSRSLVSGNTAPDGAEVAYESNSSSVVTTAYNLFGHSGLTTAEAIAGLTPAASDITATSDGSEPTALAAILEPTLQNNGGPTRTQNLVPGSPAIDAAPADANCPATDQRGESRPRGTTCDIGAVEFEAGFAFSGFFAPVNNLPVFNTVKAGQGSR